MSRDSLAVLRRIAEAHAYFSRNPDLRMTTGDHAHESKRLDAAIAALEARPDVWKDAVWDALANTCQDAPTDTPPTEILRRVIAFHVAVATDPRVSDVARPGCVVVPEFPTFAMRPYVAGATHEEVNANYAAMLAAAPKASEPMDNAALLAVAHDIMAKGHYTPGGPADPAPLTDDELPGMWSRADLIGGETDSPPHVEITTFNNGVCDVTAYKLEDGKYEIRSADNGAVVAFRYGEEWRDLTGDKLIGALLGAFPKPVK